MCQLKIMCHSKHPVKLFLHLHIFKKKKKKKKNSMQAVCFPCFCLSCIIHPQIHASCLVCTCHKTYALHRSPVYLRANTKRQPFTLMSTPSANLESSPLHVFGKFQMCKRKRKIIKKYSCYN